jgi:murein DD-endopeptidase MepM/ murein hydrolase activator NlpD
MRSRFSHFQTTKTLKFAKFSSLLVAIAVFCGLNTSISSLQASTVNQANTTEVANAWQYASFPVENFQSYTSSFGYRISPTTGKQQFHNGLDLAAPLGSYIRNWWSGQVIEVSDDTGCGTMVKIRSGDWVHAYCHMIGHIESNSAGRYLIDREGGIQIWEGQDIAVGSRIGRVGMTGNTTGPHLHWVLRYQDNLIDPALVLQQMQQQATR